MNLILLFPEDFTDAAHVQLMDYRADHIRDIHRAAVGKTLKVGRVNGGIGDGTIVSLDKTSVTLKVCIPDALPKTPEISLILALPRPQTLKKVLESIGTFGIRKLILISTERVQKSFFSSKLLKDDSWMKHLRLGMEQGGRTFLPEITIESSLRKFLPKLDGPFPDTIRLIAHPGLNASLWQTPLTDGTTKEIVCAIGPEGGWLDHEVVAFQENGFLTIRLGETVHRVENAVTAFLAQIELLRMRT